MARSYGNRGGTRRNPRFSYHIESIFRHQLLAELVDECDCVFHLAAAVGVRLVVDSPVRTLNTNVRATELLLQIASKKKRKVIIASSSEVYGKSNKFPFSEDDDLVLGPTLRARWSYGCSKAVSEFLAFGYHRERGLPIVITRLFNTVGPRQTGAYGMVVPRFVQQALSGQPITVYADGKQARCFTWVGDVVAALHGLMNLPSAVGRVFNIGSDQETTILELAKLVKQITGSLSPINFVTYEKAYGDGFEDMVRRVPDLARIREAIGYTSTKTLEEIIAAITESAPEFSLNPVGHALVVGMDV